MPRRNLNDLNKLIDGNGNKGMLQRLEDEESNSKLILKKHNQINQKINWLIFILMVILAEGLDVVNLLIKLLKR